MGKSLEINAMLDGEILAVAIGVVKSSNTITVDELSDQTGIDQEKAQEILTQLNELNFVDKFDGFYARVDLVGVN